MMSLQAIKRQWDTLGRLDPLGDAGHKQIRRL